jgi:hypothetical protein
METLSSSLQTKISAKPLSTILRHELEGLNKEFTDNIIIHSRKLKIPNEFDGRIAWSGLLTTPMNQGSCGSCWAFASTGMLSDRFNIHSLGMMNVQLSAAKLILCDWQGKDKIKIPIHPEDDILKISEINERAFLNSACYGNNLLDACRYLYEIGTPTEECVPYTKKFGLQSNFQKIGTFDNASQLPLCSTVSGPLFDMCSDFYIDNKTGVEGGTPERFYKCLHYYTVSGVKKDGGSEYNIRDNIYKFGPLASGIQVYPDFYTFDHTNIYEWDGKGSQVGGHAIEIVGWGDENGKKYWIIKNSWGLDWGEKGYFKMLRGVNMCEIESNCIGMIPDFFYPINYVIPKHEIWKETKENKADRLRISTSLDNTAGGIDPTTGYTRRVMITMPWLNLNRPVELENLPDWETFIAAEDANILNRSKKSLKKDAFFYIRKIFTIVIVIGLIILFFYIIIVYIILVLKKCK